MKVLHLLTSGSVGGIEVLCRDMGSCSGFENIFCFLFGEGLIYEEMNSKGMKVYSFVQEKKLSINKLMKIKKIANEVNVIIVHHDDPFLELYFILLKLILPSRKYVSMVHHCYEQKGNEPNYRALKGKLKEIIAGIMFGLSDKIIFVSKAGCKSYLPKYKINRKKISIIYNGISQDKIKHGKYVSKIKQKTIHILYAGRLVRIKGVDQLIKAFSLLSADYPIVLDIVGDGEEVRMLQKLTEKLNISEKVKFWGFKKDITHFLEYSDIFVYPSKTEIFGIALVEAMAFKNICVANTVGGIPEIICDGVNGILNKENSASGLAKSILRAVDVCNDPEQRRKMMNEANITAGRFTIERTVKRLEKLFESDNRKI